MTRGGTGAYNTEAAKYATRPVYLLRFFHVPDYAKSTEYPFARDFVNRDPGGLVTPALAYVSRLSGGAQTVVPGAGQLTIGAMIFELIDRNGEMMQYLSAQPLTLNGGIAAGAGPPFSVLVNETPDGIPRAGTIEITTAGVIERMRYTSVNNGAKTIQVSARGVDGTVAAEHFDKDALTNGEQIRPGQRVQVIFGYDGTLVANGLWYAKLEVAERYYAGDGVTVVLKAQDIQRSLLKDIFLTATEDAPFKPWGDPLGILLLVLLSTDVPGSNHATWDAYGVGNGLAVPAALVDVAGIEALRGSDFLSDYLEFEVKAPIDGKTWIETEILKVLNCYPFVGGDGKYSVKRYKPLTDPGAVTETLTSADIKSWSWAAGDPTIINRVIIFYDWDLPEAPGAFGLSVQYDATSSQKKYGIRPAFVIESKGLKSSHAGTDAIIDDKALKLFQRFSEPTPILNVNVLYRKHRWEVADQIKVTHAQIPNLVNGKRGITNEVFEIVGITPRFGIEGGLQLSLLDIQAVNFTGAWTRRPPIPVGGSGINAPPTPGGLQLVGGKNATEFLGRDVKFSWTKTLYVKQGSLNQAARTGLNQINDYVIHVLVGGVIKRIIESASNRLLYSWEENTEDNGSSGARTITINVFARTNAGVLSAAPATLTVSNPAPTMAAVTPTVTPLIQGLLIGWSAFSSTETDLDHFEVLADTVNPPTTVVARATKDAREIALPNLTAGTTYYIKVVPYDAFGAGVASAVASGVPNATLYRQVNDVAAYTGFAGASDGQLSGGLAVDTVDNEIMLVVPDANDDIQFGQLSLFGVVVTALTLKWTGKFDHCACAFDGTDLQIVLEEATGPNDLVQYARLDKDGAVEQAPTTLWIGSGLGTAVVAPAIAARGTNLYLVWGADGIKIRYTRTSLTGTIQVDGVLIVDHTGEPSGTAVWSPRVAVDASGNVHVLYALSVGDGAGGILREETWYLKIDPAGVVLVPKKKVFSAPLTGTQRRFRPGGLLIDSKEELAALVASLVQGANGRELYLGKLDLSGGVLVPPSMLLSDAIAVLHFATALDTRSDDLYVARRRQAVASPPTDPTNTLNLVKVVKATA